VIQSAGPITAVRLEELPSLIGAMRQRLDAELPPQQGTEFLIAAGVLMGLKYEEQFTEASVLRLFGSEPRESARQPT
jgi:hypothetical protein